MNDTRKKCYTYQYIRAAKIYRLMLVTKLQSRQKVLHQTSISKKAPPPQKLHVTILRCNFGLVTAMAWKSWPCSKSIDHAESFTAEYGNDALEGVNERSSIWDATPLT